MRHTSMWILKGIWELLPRLIISPRQPCCILIWQIQQKSFPSSVKTMNHHRKFNLVTFAQCFLGGGGCGGGGLAELSLTSMGQVSSSEIKTRLLPSASLFFKIIGSFSLSQVFSKQMSAWHTHTPGAHTHRWIKLGCWVAPDALAGNVGIKLRT